MAPGQVLGVRQLGPRGGGQGAVPGHPGRVLRALRLQQAAPLRRRRLRHRGRRGRPVGHGRLPRRDGRHDEPGNANGDLRGAAAAVRGHVPGRHHGGDLHRASSGPTSPDPNPALHVGAVVAIAVSFRQSQNANNAIA